MRRNNQGLFFCAKTIRFGYLNSKTNFAIFCLPRGGNRELDFTSFTRFDNRQTLVGCRYAVHCTCRLNNSLTAVSVATTHIFHFHVNIAYFLCVNRLVLIAILKIH